MKILKSNSQSKSGKTFYFYVNVPANVLTIKEGVFCGTCNKETANIDEIQWMYNFGKKCFSITLNGKYKLEDYIDVIEKYSK